MPNSLLSLDRQLEITKEVEAILSQYGNTDIMHLLESVARDNNIELMEGDLGDASGFLEKIDSKWRITINALEPVTRKIFTIAHELGHYFLHRDKETSFVDGGYATTFARSEATRWHNMEVEANEFAGQLVMPQSVIERLVEDKKSEVPSSIIYELSQRFKVSKYAIMVRLSNLGYSVSN